MKRLTDIDDPGTVLVRTDLNSPIVDGTVRDNKRFERHAETVKRLVDAGNAVVVLAHQGRPGRDDFTSLEEHAALLGDHIGQSVAYQDSVHTGQTRQAVQELGRGEVLMLENVRFLSEELENRSPEEHAESLMVQRLSRHADYYVNDAFSAAHRPHASLTGFAPVLDCYAGTVMEEELRNTRKIRDGLDGTTKMLAGGAKPADVLKVMEAMADEVDEFLLAGVIAKLFLRAKDIETGKDRLVDKTYDENRETVERLLDEHDDAITLPADYAREVDSERVEDCVGSLDEGSVYLDIGSRTIEQYRERLQQADSVVVKGAPGAFEDEPFQAGTRELLDTIRTTDCFSVVGGGDTTAALDVVGVPEDGFDHLSIAGGAYIRSLIGEDLAAVEALERFS